MHWKQFHKVKEYKDCIEVALWLMHNLLFIIYIHNTFSTLRIHAINRQEYGGKWVESCCVLVIKRIFNWKTSLDRFSMVRYSLWSWFRWCFLSIYEPNWCDTVGTWVDGLGLVITINPVNLEKEWCTRVALMHLKRLHYQKDLQHFIRDLLRIF